MSKNITITELIILYKEFQKYCDKHNKIPRRKLNKGEDVNESEFWKYSFSRFMKWLERAE